MQRENAVQHVFLVGAKSLGAYGGYETFVYKLTEYHQNKKNIKYHVACKANGDGYMDETKVDGVTRINDHEFEFHNAHCFKIDIPQIGPAQAIYYDVAALKACCKYIKEHRIKHPIVYIMACRIGPFAGHFYKEIHKLGGTVYLNPDGHEWMRAKWSAPIRKYWKISEQMMVKYCDLAICDSVNIEKYIHECYDGKGIKGRNPKTTFIAYGADLTLSKLADDDEKLMNWYREKGLTKKDYYLVVGRFVPENSFEVMIREFMKSKSKKNFAIITNVNEKFLNELEEKLHFKSDKRIKFVGTVYDQELLKKIRENAYAYFHGHTVGGSIKKEKGNKAVILILDDLHDSIESSENISWHYDTDFEFLNDDSIKQIIVTGVRHLDTYVRLRLADIPKRKIEHMKDEIDATKKIKLKNIDSIYILYDVYTVHLRDKVKDKLKEIIDKEEV